MKVSEFEAKLNQWGQERVPFLFIVDFELEESLAWKQNDVPADVLYYLEGFASNVESNPRKESVSLMKYPISFSEYESKFNTVKNRIALGDSYLTNLTIKTKIETNYSLEELFWACVAKYKLCWKNKFLVFSPEPFIQIKHNRIYSFPMKGTIDASIPGAEEMILSDTKEMSEHVTIVDLIRNDLSAVAANVNVNRFRYVEKIRTSHKTLIQVSSEICGDLPYDFAERMGSLLIALLPAGSVSGAPKKMTLEIIRESEMAKRGYYTGVFGYFDGTSLDSAVMIRFIEQENNNLFYRSGGGITAQSQVESEYLEAIDKIYVPVY